METSQKWKFRFSWFPITFNLFFLDFPGIPTWGHPLRDWYRRFRILTSKEPAAISNFDQGARPPCVAGADRLAGPGQPSQLGQLARAAAGWPDFATTKGIHIFQCMTFRVHPNITCCMRVLPQLLWKYMISIGASLQILTRIYTCEYNA